MLKRIVKCIVKCIFKCILKDTFRYRFIYISQCSVKFNADTTMQYVASFCMVGATCCCICVRKRMPQAVYVLFLVCFVGCCICSLRYVLLFLLLWSCVFFFCVLNVFASFHVLVCVVCLFVLLSIHSMFCILKDTFKYRFIYVSQCNVKLKSKKRISIQIHVHIQKPIQTHFQAQNKRYIQMQTQIVVHHTNTCSNTCADTYPNTYSNVNSYEYSKAYSNTCSNASSNAYSNAS